MNSYRNYVGNSNSLAKNLEKLSSGYRINRAGDAAAGLAISEKMRAQISGLGQAQSNVKDGISLVKTAEGALQEVQNMMNRMVTLATQSANGTYQNEVDRENLQAEVEELKKEINRIADSSNYNGQKLLDGSLAQVDASTTIPEGTELQDMSLTTDGIGAANPSAVAAANEKVGFKNTVKDADGNDKGLAADTTKEALEIKFKDENGKEHILTLIESGVNGIDVAGDGNVESAIVNALNGDGTAFEFGPADQNTKDTFAKFQELFNVAAGTNGFTFQAKNDTGSAELVSFKIASAPTDDEVAEKALEDSGVKSTETPTTAWADGTAGVSEFSTTLSDTQADVIKVSFTYNDGTDTKEYSALVKESDIKAWDYTGAGSNGALLAALAGATVLDADGQDAGTLGAYFTFAEAGTASDGMVKATAKAKTAGHYATGVTFTHATYTKPKMDGAEAKAALDAAETLREDATLSEKAVEKDSFDITVAANNGKTTSITVGDKTYAIDGSADAEADAAKLAEMLKKDGYTAEIQADGKTIRLIAEELQEAQKGTQITNATDDKWDVNAATSTKGNISFKMLANATTANTFTLNYVNENGESVSKEISYTPTAGSDAGNAAGLKAAIEGDSELKKLFKVDIAGDNVTMTITSKGSGTGSAYLTGLSTGGALDISGLKIDTPKNLGKELTLQSGEKFASGDQVTIDGKTYQFMSDTGKAVADGVVKVAIGATEDETWENLKDALAKDGVKAELMKGATKGLRFTDSDAAKVAPKKTTGGLTLQIGDTAESYNQLNVSIENMHTKALGIDDVDISNIKGAQNAIETIKTAINKVSSTRGNLGAIQNRLEHTQANLSVMTENITDAESTIRDTDIADEMTTYTKNNILLQSAQPMLAQANQMPQGVLQLLQ